MVWVADQLEREQTLKSIKSNINRWIVNIWTPPKKTHTRHQGYSRHLLPSFYLSSYFSHNHPKTHTLTIRYTNTEQPTPPSDLIPRSTTRPSSNTPETAVTNKSIRD